MKRIVSFILLLIVIISVYVPQVNAASYPSLYPKIYKLYVAQGKTAKLEFKLFSEYKHEQYHVNVYEGREADPNKLVASASDTMYTTSGMTDITINWDTTGYDCGVYTVEYYMSFYSIYEWHDEPTKHTSMTVEIFALGQVANYVLNTDIKAFIDGHPIRSYNIDGYTSIVVEDLNQYGFSVVYDGNERTLKIDDPRGTITSTYTHIQNTQPVGSKAMDVYYTDIKTYVKSQKTSSYFHKYGYNVDGFTLIRIDDLGEFGTVTWNEAERTISFSRN